MPGRAFPGEGRSVFTHLLRVLLNKLPCDQLLKYDFPKIFSADRVLCLNHTAILFPPLDAEFDPSELLVI
jgi:hypothetical protein